MEVVFVREEGILFGASAASVSVAARDYHNTRFELTWLIGQLFVFGMKVNVFV